MMQVALGEDNDTAETHTASLSRLKHDSGRDSAGVEAPLAMTPSTPSTESAWKLAFSTEDRTRNFAEEVISAIEYDPSGDFLATGNTGGRISVYARKDNSDSRNQMGPGTGQVPYALYTEFQSHDIDADYLVNLGAEERINQIEWCQPTGGAQYLLSTNDKAIKLWKIHERSLREVTAYNQQELAHRTHIELAQIRLPVSRERGHTIMATARRVYTNAHTYNINSIALNTDGETFLSADDLRVNLWSLGISDECFNIVDIKPSNMDDLMEVITAADFHPSRCNIMAYSTSRGAIKLGDLRQAALCDEYSQVFVNRGGPATHSFFSELSASISDIKFSPDGRYMIARDFLTLNVWDINMNSRPVQTINIHEHLRQRLYDLYKNECVFDKFACGVSGDGNNFITGSYNNEFHIYDRHGRSDVSITPGPDRTVNASRHRFMLQQGLAQPSTALSPSINPYALDFSKKILQASWHPTNSEVAVSIRNSLFVYTIKPTGWRSNTLSRL